MREREIERNREKVLLTTPAVKIKMFLKSHPQKCNTNAVSKSNLTCDSMQLYTDKWTSRSDLVTDGFFLPSVALISFHGAE